LVRFIEFYLNKLPLLDQIQRLLFNQFGPAFNISHDWWAFFLGFPLMAESILIFLISLSELLLAIVFREYNLTHCPFCYNSVKIKDGKVIS